MFLFEKCQILASTESRPANAKNQGSIKDLYITAHNKPTTEVLHISIDLFYHSTYSNRFYPALKY